MIDRLVMPPFILFLTSVAGFLSIKCNFLCLICVWLTVCSRNSARENPSWALFRHCFGKFNEPNYLVAVTLTFKKCCIMKCWKYFFNGRGKATTTEVHLHFVLTWAWDVLYYYLWKVWISWNWYFPRACAMLIYCNLDHSLQAVAVIFVLIRSGLFVSFNSVSGKLNWARKTKWIVS